MSEFRIFKAKYKGPEKPDYFEKYQLRDEYTLAEFKDNHKNISELIDYLTDPKTIQKKGWCIQIIYEKPFDTETCEKGIIIARDLNFLERFLFNRRLAKKFKAL